MYIQDLLQTCSTTKNIDLGQFCKTLDVFLPAHGSYGIVDIWDKFHCSLFFMSLIISGLFDRINRTTPHSFRSVVVIKHSLINKCYILLTDSHFINTCSEALLSWNLWNLISLNVSGDTVSGLGVYFVSRHEQTSLIKRGKM